MLHRLLLGAIVGTGLQKPTVSACPSVGEQAWRWCRGQAVPQPCVSAHGGALGRRCLGGAPGKLMPAGALGTSLHLALHPRSVRPAVSRRESREAQDAAPPHLSELAAALVQRARRGLRDPWACPVPPLACACFLRSPKLPLPLWAFPGFLCPPDSPEASARGGGAASLSVRSRLSAALAWPAATHQTERTTWRHLPQGHGRSDKMRIPRCQEQDWCRAPNRLPPHGGTQGRPHHGRAPFRLSADP